jgi:hypothetical protein
MYSRAVAFVLLLVACVAAAAGGAYIATHQNVPSTPAAASQSAVPEPQPPSNDAAAAPPPASETAGDTGDKTPPQDRVGSPTAGSAPDATTSGSAHPVRQSAGRAAGTSRAPDRPRSATRGQADTAQAASPPTVSANGVPSAASTSAPGGTPPAPDQPVPPATPPPDSPARDAQAPPSPRQREFAELVVPAESVLGLQLETTVTSEQAHVEDRVEARVTRDVRVGEQVAIPAGSRVAGSVVLVDRGGKVKDRARLAIQFDTLLLADSTRLSIRTDAVYREGASPANQSAAKIGGGAVGGAILGAIIGGGKGAAIGGSIGAAGGTAAVMAGGRRAAVLTAGTVLSVRLLTPVTVTIDK